MLLILTNFPQDNPASPVWHTPIRTTSFCDESRNITSPPKHCHLEITYGKPSDLTRVQV